MAMYRTKQGDSWDMIAHRELGDVALTGRLMELNGEYLSYYTFPAGIHIRLPEAVKLPRSAPAPWKQVAG